MGAGRPVQLVCRRCGSADVIIDAYVVWDTDTQDFVVSSVYEGTAYCTECDSEMRAPKRVDLVKWKLAQAAGVPLIEEKPE